MSEEGDDPAEPLLLELRFEFRVAGDGTEQDGAAGDAEEDAMSAA